MKLYIQELRAMDSKSIATECPTQYGFSNMTVHAFFKINDKTEQPEVSFRVYRKDFDEWKNCIFECESYHELKKWCEEHWDEIN